jgi:hypothetical protein
MEFRNKYTFLLQGSLAIWKTRNRQFLKRTFIYIVIQRSFSFCFLWTCLDSIINPLLDLESEA